MATRLNVFSVIGDVRIWLSWGISILTTKVSHKLVGVKIALIIFFLP